MQQRCGYSFVIEIQVVNEADLDALDRILNSFEVVGDLPTP